MTRLVFFYRLGDQEKNMKSRAFQYLELKQWRADKGGKEGEVPKIRRKTEEYSVIEDMIK